MELIIFPKLVISARKSFKFIYIERIAAQKPPNKNLKWWDPHLQCIFTSIFINAIQEGLTLKRLPLTLFCLSLHYPTYVATLPYTALEIGQVVQHCD